MDETTDTLDEITKKLWQAYELLPDVAPVDTALAEAMAAVREALRIIDPAGLAVADREKAKRYRM